MKTLFITVLFCGLSMLISGAASAHETLRSPYLAPARDAEAHVLSSCPKPPRSVRVLEYKSIYTDRSEGASIVDPAALKTYRAAVKPIRDYERGLEKIVTSAFLNTDQENKFYNCGLQWLYRWASGEALLGRANGQGKAVRKWTLATLASFYVQIKDAPNLPIEKKRIVEAWFNLLAQTVRNDYSGEPDKHTQQNNHLYWAAWAVMITSIVTDDRELFDWSVRQYKKGIDQISDDGTLPLEMERMGKAFNYHVFAAGPLVMLAETAQANGVDLYKYRQGRIHHFVDRIMSELETDQSYIAKETGTEQDLTGTLTPAMLAWMEPYYARFHDEKMKPWLDKLRPMDQRRLGGDLTRIYHRRTNDGTQKP